jgi:NADPH2:quinone reductase
VRAALIHQLGEPPVIGAHPHPGDTDGTGVDVAAVALNPVDIAIASGRFYGGHPPLPYVLGIEAVGRTDDGRWVYLQGGGRGIVTDGFAATRVAVPDDLMIELPDDADPVAAVALGTAGLAGWLSVTSRARVTGDDRVVVLGASGAVGNIAVQAAHLAGAECVVGVARTTSRIPTSATAVSLGTEDLAAAVTRAAGGPPTVVIDMLWGDALMQVLPAVAAGARVVNVGASAGAEATIPSAAVRGKQLNVLGYSNFGVPRPELVAAYQHLVALHTAGDLHVGVADHPLDRVADAWHTAVAGTGKAVIRFGEDT